MAAYLALALALVLWGIWGLLHKMAVNRAHPFTVEWMNTVPYVVLLPLWLFLGSRFGGAMNVDKRTFLLSAGGGICGMVATLCVLFALRDRPASLVIAVTAGYPMVTFLLATATRMEAFHAGRAAGVALIVLGIVVLSLTADAPGAAAR